MKMKWWANSGRPRATELPNRSLSRVVSQCIGPNSTFGKVPVRLARDSSHQYPLGVSMGQERWLELLDWADKIVWDVRAERQHSPATPDQREPCKRKNLHRSKRMASPAGFLYGGPIACKVARRFCGLSSRAGPRRSSERFALRRSAAVLRCILVMEQRARECPTHRMAGPLGGQRCTEMCSRCCAGTEARTPHLCDNSGPIPTRNRSVIACCRLPARGS